MRSTIITATILAIALFVIAWIGYPYILVNYLIFIKQSGIQVSMRQGEGGFRIFASAVITIAILPVLSVLATVAANRLKNRSLHGNLFFTYFMIITLGYLLGVVVKFLYELYSFKRLDSLPHPNVILSVPMDQVMFYQHGFSMAVMAAIVAVIFTKKKEVEKATVYGN